MESSTAVPSQYHHYVPQFLLKNFAHKYKPPKGRSAAPKNKANGKAAKKLHKGDLVLNYVDLSPETPERKEVLVKRVFGQTDMYRDVTKPYKEQHRVEEMFSRLESDASIVFRKITQAFQNGSDSIWITRVDRNLVRKFLFLMKYRSSAFHRRFYHDLATDYDANDRAGLLEYMRKRGFVYPMDVWLDNIKVIIDLEMDDDLNWVSELPKRIFPDDARWAISHMQSMYMAICTPSGPQEEFLLTDNSYRIFEGPSNETFYANAGTSEGSTWFNFHDFAPLSPKLMIIFRSVLLPEPVDDQCESWSRYKKEAWPLVVEKPFGSGTNSVLADLPVCKPRNNYSQFVNNRLQLLPGQDGSLQPDHQFCFKFFPVNTNHLNRINAILLENSSTCDGIVYDSVQSFRKTLEFFMTEPVHPGKRVSSHPRDPRLQSLKKLANVLKELGSNANPVWEEIAIPELDDESKARLAISCLKSRLPLLLDHIPEDSPTEFMQLYYTLGGSKKKLARDFEQSELMLRLRIKIDVWSKGVREEVRQKNRDELIDTYLEFPRRRVWFYVKRWRIMAIKGPNRTGSSINLQDEEFALSGPEDVIASSWRVIEQTKFNRLMYNTVRNDIILRTALGFNPWPENRFTFGKLRGHQRPQEMLFMNNLRDCGIKAIEERVQSHEAMMRITGVCKPDEGGRSILDEDQGIELMSRQALKNQIKYVLGQKLEAQLLEQLAVIFFELIYPVM